MASSYQGRNQMMKRFDISFWNDDFVYVHVRIFGIAVRLIFVDSSHMSGCRVLKYTY